jgi:Cd2+/Zn2+-exporting ATPase
LVRKLHALGIKRTVMLTGDNRATAESIAGQLGIDEVRAELMPQMKLEAIRELQQAGGSGVAMVGDGVNDAPALAAATVGVAMGGAGTDAALETASIVLMGDDLSKLPFAIRLSRRALAVIKQNIAFSLLIKAVALLLIVPGWLTLWMAVFADMGATLIVTLNALRLLRPGRDAGVPGRKPAHDTKLAGNSGSERSAISQIRRNSRH